MSERSKGDTSSSLLAAPPSSGRVVKNPLLSASVTGLTFDDFQNKPLLLPAAPPIVHTSPVVSRESTPLVTVGKSSEIDTENLSEINLNDTSTASLSNIADTSDENSNSLIESTNPVDNSILSQAASSFSQLPSVASSVFSSFSKKFNSSPEKDDYNSNPQLDIQPFNIPFVGQTSTTQGQIVPPPSAFNNNQHQLPTAPPPLSQSQAPPVNPPTFYSPSEGLSVASGPPCPPPVSGQNSYRLSAKKKLYAQIPGLSSSHQEPTLPATGFPPPIGFESLGTPVYSENPSYDKPEERKAGLFSLSNLGVPNVLQNLTGLVQSATGISQSPQEQIQQQPFSNFGNIQVGQTAPPAVYPKANPISFTGIETTGPPSSSGNFFAPPAQEQVSPFAATSGPPVGAFVQPLQGPPPIGIQSAGLPPQSTTPLQPFLQPGFTPASLSQLPAFENQLSGQQQESTTTESLPRKHSQPDSISDQASLGSSPNLFVPPQTAGINFVAPPPKSVTPQSTLTSEQLTEERKNSSPVIPISSAGQTPPEAHLVRQSFPPSQTLFSEAKAAGIPFQASHIHTTESNLTPQFPPQVKPPTAGSQSTSFRLQKGTRLYKSPFAPTPSEYQPQVQIPHSTLPPNPEVVNYFNPPPPQGVFPLGSGISQPTSSQETILKPVQEQSSSGHFSSSSVNAPPQDKVTTQVVNYFNPKGVLPPQDFSALRQEVSQPTLPQETVLNPAPTDIPFSLYKKTENIPTSKVVNFVNPQGITSLLGETTLNQEIPKSTLNQEITLKPVEEASILAPTNISSSHSSVSAPPIDEVADGPPKESTPPLSLLDTTNASTLHPGSEEILTKSADILSSSNAPQLDKSPEPISTGDEINFFAPQKLTTTPETSISSEQTSTITESETKQDTLTFYSDQQNNILPPPPATSFGISSSSKETANFPPPPPQHSFQNKPSSNPYRKGLQSHHPQFPAATSLSSFFTPIDQGNNFYQFIGSESIPHAPQPSAPFTAENPSVIHQEEPLSPEIVKVAEESTLESNELLKEDPVESAQIPSAPPSESPQPISEPTQLEDLLTTESTPNSLVASSQEPNINLLKSEAPETTASSQPFANLVSFYKPDACPSSNNTSVAVKPVENSKIASPLDSQKAPVSEQKPVPNLFTGFFNQEAASSVADPTPVVVHRPSLPDPTTFFDSFSLVPSLGIAAPPPEDPNSQRIQNFFNNPPPKELDTVGDLNYNLVGSGLSVQNLQIRSLTPASNLAEPPSSSCSEFSELNSSLSAANRQQLIQAADSTKVSPEEEAVFESPEYQDLPEEIVNELKMSNSILANSSPTNESYKPAVKHWFYKRKLDVKCLWAPFSYHDSALLEEAFLKGDEGSNLVAVEGGRFDVNISERTKTPVYWEGDPIEVKRCSWFYKASDSKYVPYEEEIADLLEEEYKKASESCEWHKKIPISAGDIVVFHGPTVIVHFQPQQQVDSWGGSTQTITRPRVVKRDLDDFHIDEGESHKVDHLLFMVHGIGSACDLKMRSVEEVVDEFRSIALQLVQSHYKNSVESGFVGRVEVLPVSWHSELHSDELGIDEKLKSITLESIPKLRNFTNDTLLDILFYTSPMFCQRIINTVTASMNSIYMKYRQRHPEFQGGISLAGHSLGSLIMFDLLCHQRPHKESEDKNMENPDEMTSSFPVDSNQLNEEAAKNITYKMGQAGTGQPFISYPQLLFQPKQFFALGSPIGMFVTIRGIDKLGLDFRLPTCPGFYNIFHPYDPVAYRLEALVNSDMNGIPPVLIPHHKGRKRMHLELKETMSRVGADLKQRFFETFKTTIDSVNFLTPKLKNDPKELEKEVDKLLELQAHQEQPSGAVASTSRSRANSNSTNQSDTDAIEIDLPLGKLNDSKRVDYVLQEAPLEFFNEYLFALSSHVCYWESEDTILFVMKQIYGGIGYSPDSQVPQQTLTIERPSSRSSAAQQSPTS